MLIHHFANGFALAQFIMRHGALDDIFAKDDEGLDLATGDAVGDLHQIDTHLGKANTREPGAVGVRIPVGTHQQLIRFALTRNGIAQSTQSGL